MNIKTTGKIKLFQNLWPAAITGFLIACGASSMKPTLAQVPELLEYTASAKNDVTDKPKLKNTSDLKKAVKKVKKEEAKGESSTDAFTDQDSYTDGMYTGSAQGFGGTITVQVTVTGGKIADVIILSAPGETSSYLVQAQAVINRIISAGSPNVDVVSGATFSSNGILNAVKRALASAGGTSTDLYITELAPVVQDSTPIMLTPVIMDPSSITGKPSNSLKDGTYTGSANGFGGPVTVRVSIVEGKIAGISVIAASGETGSFFSRAQAVIPQILTAQSPDVDSVSGATYSSNGIKNAVRNAISQAVVNSDETITNPDQNDSASTKPETDLKPDIGDQAISGTDKPAGPGTESDPPIADSEEEESVIYPDLWKKELSEIVEKPEKEWKDGSFRGIGEGFGGDIELEITVLEGKIIRIEVIEARKETPAFFNKAKALLGDILEKQTSQVDVISGATFSSEGIIEALEEALKAAAASDETTENLENEKKPEDEENHEDKANCGDEENDEDDGNCEGEETDRGDENSQENRIQEILIKAKRQEGD